MQIIANHALEIDDSEQEDISVLLIEDDEDDYLLTRDLFEQAYGHHYSLTWESNPDKAIKLLGSTRFDVCLVDYRLGGITGIELIEMIQTDEHPEMATILLTGVENHDVDLQATNAGATDYLVKSQLKAETLERSIRYSRRQKDSESRVRHLAFHDSLTELANRSLFTKHLDRSISTARRHKEFGALLFIDLDNFKTVNDSLGHSVGDGLLVEFSKRLKQNVRHEDVVARFGGDEFVLLFTRLAGEEEIAYDQVSKLTDKIRSKLLEPIYVDDHELRIGCSIGITLFSDGGASSETLLTQADMAMYRAKNDGKNVVRFFNASMEESVKANYWVEQDLHNALNKDQFELFYQPIVALNTKKTIGAEALIRWRHPDRGLVMPDKFITTAENGNYVCEIGKFVIAEACSFVNGLPALDYISVNISARHFENDTFYGDLTSILDRTSTNPARIVIELTESTILKDIRLAQAKMLELGKIGIRFALDDFGTGYSSLSVLRDLPIHILKIDRSFISDIGADPYCDAITEAIITMSNTLGLEVIAEGLETPEQLKFLTRHDCIKAQGYYFSKPVPAEIFIAWLRS